jgi:hypothetical protein
MKHYDHFYILDGHTPVPTHDPMKWGRMMEDIDTRRVAQNTVGDVWVSTVFLGLDHNWGDGPPLLFETMAFRDKQEIAMDRYSTWAEAEAGHTAMLVRLAAADAEHGAEHPDDQHRDGK